jgi:hypothetical protein
MVDQDSPLYRALSSPFFVDAPQNSKEFFRARMKKGNRVRQSVGNRYVLRPMSRRTA